MDQSFWLHSTELRDYTVKHECRVLSVVDAGSQPARLLVEVTPPLPGHLYNLAQDLDQVILAPRLSGASLVPEVSEWPCPVYICAPSGGAERGWTSLEILDWGMIER